MIFVDGRFKPSAYWEFLAQLWLFEDVKALK
jgi:hypothetical protein